MIKVCGMTRAEDARAATDAGADLLGFIFHDGSPRNVTAEFVASVDAGGAAKVGVFVRQDAGEVRDIMRRAGLTYAQLHGGQEPDFCHAVGPERVIKVFWPERYPDRAALEADMARYADCAALFLLDAGASGGGHGRSLDFTALSEISSPRPLLLAGGLCAENLPQAIRACAPGGVDLNSGVESAPGVKDAAKLAAAVAAVKNKAKGQRT